MAFLFGSLTYYSYLYRVKQIKPITMEEYTFKIIEWLREQDFTINVIFEGNTEVIISLSINREVNLQVRRYYEDVEVWYLEKTDTENEHTTNTELAKFSMVSDTLYDELIKTFGNIIQLEYDKV